MRKIFTFLFAALMSVGMFAATEVTITNSDFPMSGKSFTKDGVTVSAGNIDGMGNINGPGSFSTTLGNFTKIEVTANNVSIVGPGWNGTSGKKTWTGNASSLSFNGGIMSMGMGVTLKFTIADPTVAVTGVTLNQNEAQMTVGGETLTLTATVNPNNATDQSVSWSTSDANVATVKNGVVTAVAAGTATITVTTTDGYFTATCAVTVSNPAPAGEVITWDSDDLNTFPEYLLQGESKTIKGITVTVNQGNLAAGNSQVGFNPNGSNDAFTFSTELGNFTKIECTTLMVTGSLGEGWESATWTGNANSVNFGNAGSFLVVSSITFTIEPASTPEPEPEPAVGPKEQIELGNSGCVGTYYQVLGGGDGTSWRVIGGNDNATMTIESLNGEIIDNITLKVYFPSSWTGYSIASTSGTVSGDVANYQDLVVTNINATSVTLSRVGEGNANGSVSFHRIIVNEGSTTAIENTAVDTKAVKRIVNGQLLIEKNGKIYNATGAEIK